MDFFARIAENPIVLTIPILGAIIGWVERWAAIRMMFYPTEFVGIKPFLGWQGIVPANAKRLARMSTRLILTKLLTLEELFASFKGDAFAKEMKPVVDQITNQVIDEVAAKRAPMLWTNAGEFMQKQIRDKVSEEVTALSVQVVDDFSANITEILDLEKVSVDAAERDKKLMSQMFLEVGASEFKFIEISGIYFGFAIGLIQMCIWVYYPLDWTLPFAGFLVGCSTDWVALKMIFHPRVPTKVGPFTFHGLFHKRQKEVAKAFSALTAERVLNADNMTQTITEGPTGEKVLGIIEKRVNALIDKYLSHPMAAMVVPEGDRPALREELLGRIREEVPKEGGLLHTFAAKSVNIQHELEYRMTKLKPDEFEGVLRPAFQQDEWKLILTGGVIGFVTGCMHVFWVLT